MKQKVLKQNKSSQRRGKTAVIFPDWACSSVNLFLHCARIPDVMVHIVKIREICKRYKIPAPPYLFGCSASTVRAPYAIKPLHVMSFAVGLGLYDRLLRVQGPPHLLIGGSPALLVSAKVKSYEKTLLKILYGTEEEPASIRIYQNESVDSGASVKGVGSLSSPFSLLYFSRTGGGRNIYPNIIKEHKISRCISLTCSPLRKRRKMSATQAVAMENVIETDPQLNWFLPILKKSQARGKIISSAFHAHTDFR